MDEASYMCCKPTHPDLWISREGPLSTGRALGRGQSLGRTACSNVNGEESTPFTLTMLFGDVYQLRKILQALPFTPDS